MIGSDCVTRARQLLNDPNNTGRWSDNTLLGYLSEAQQVLIRDIQFPESRIIIDTIADQQEYSTPELITVYRVYMNGQLLVPQDLQTLEGHQIQQYDQGLASGAREPGTQAPGSGGPAGNLGNYTPAVWVEPPATYPVANNWGTPGPDAGPWTPVSVGGRPIYYWRGGFIGIVPAPAAGGYSLTIDCLIVPTDVTTLGQTMLFANNMRMALVWKMVEYAKFSDDDDTAARQAQVAMSNYEKEMRKLRINRRQYDGDSKRMPKFLTQRSFFQKGNNRNLGEFPEYP